MLQQLTLRLLATPAGLPASDKFYYCNAALGSCYFWNTVTANYTTHRANCQRMGGYLVSYNSGLKQYTVEQALSPTDISLPANNYYLGIEPLMSNTNLTGGFFVMLDGTFLGNTTPSNSDPYKHW